MERRSEELGAAERLMPLLEWLNLDPESVSERRKAEEDADYRPGLSAREVRQRLIGFAKSFTSYPVRVGKLTIPARLDPTQNSARVIDNQLEMLRLRLANMLLHGGGAGDVLRSLHFHVELTLDGPTLRVGGQLPDVVLYLAAHLVVTEKIELDLCEAPEALPPGRPTNHDWRRHPACGKLFVARGGKRYCDGEACRTRAKNPNWRRRTR